MRRLLILLWSALPALALAGEAPRHVVLVIGDGMGLTQVTAARAQAGQDLFLQSAEAVGLQTTWSTSLVTDSAAGATAMACGVKTDNGMIGQTPDGTPCRTLMEEALAAGRGTAVVVTSRVTHATPASFLAHQASRKQEREIALQLAEQPVDVLVGGGRDRFPKTVPAWDRRGVAVVDGAAGFLASRTVPVVAFTAVASPPPITERGPTAPLAAHALDLVDEDPEGAFVLVEGSQVDWGGHANRADYVVAEVLDLDATVKALVEARDDTLVVVTADHETGGLSLMDGSPSGGPITTRFATDHHTAVMVPVYAWGPGADAFTGVYDNTDLHRRLRAALGLGAPATPGGG